MIYIPNRPGSRIPGALESRFFFPGVGGGCSQKNWLGVYGPLPKTPTIFMTKICDLPYTMYDLTQLR